MSSSLNSANLQSANALIQVHELLTSGKTELETIKSNAAFNFNIEQLNGDITNFTEKKSQIDAEITSYENAGKQNHSVRNQLAQDIAQKRAEAQKYQAAINTTRQKIETAKQVQGQASQMNGLIAQAENKEKYLLGLDKQAISDAEGTADKARDVIAKYKKLEQASGIMFITGNTSFQAEAKLNNAEKMLKDVKNYSYEQKVTTSGYEFERDGIIDIVNQEYNNANSLEDKSKLAKVATLAANIGLTAIAPPLGAIAAGILTSSDKMADSFIKNNGQMNQKAVLTALSEGAVAGIAAGLGAHFQGSLNSAVMQKIAQKVGSSLGNKILNSSGQFAIGVIKDTASAVAMNLIEGRDADIMKSLGNACLTNSAALAGTRGKTTFGAGVQGNLNATMASSLNNDVTSAAGKVGTHSTTTVRPNGRHGGFQGTF